VAYELPAIRSRVRAVVQDDAGFIADDEVNECIDAALEQLNEDRPQEVKKDITGDGTADYNLETEYVKGFSNIDDDGVEYPAGENPPQTLDRNDDWIVYEDPSKVAGQQMRLLLFTVTPNTTETIRVTIRTPHAVTESASSMNQTEFSAVCWLAAANVLLAIAAKYTQDTDPEIEADTVDRGTGASALLTLADRYRRRYEKLVGLNADVKAAHTVADKDIIFDHGEDFLWHSKRNR